MMANEETEGNTNRPLYDIFLSYHGDTRFTFTGNLYNALRHKRFRVFMDDSGSAIGDQISPSIIKAALQESKVSIVIFCEQYASSVRCLEELVEIAECTRTKGQLVWPIFYKVHPSEVRKREDLQRWKATLTYVTEMAGWMYGTTRYEYEFIQKIVQSAVETLHRYDIFLSFAGEDTRYSFTGFLYNALQKEGFNTFMDDEGLVRGSEFWPGIVQAIERSRLSIIVFSENFGDSTWCLDEVAEIMECMNTKNQLVLPIFYKVAQSDVSNQTNSYGKAMAAHERTFREDPEKVQKWRSALSQVANLQGFDFETGKEYAHEYELIQKIVERAIELENHLYVPSPSSSVN